MNRRDFLSLVTAAVGSSALPARGAPPSEVTADVAILGGGVGGCAAALAALRAGRRVVLAEETDWLGGQLTSQVVPPDEHQWIETHGGTRAYRRLRDAVRDRYREHYPLTNAARAQTQLNPGNGWVSRLCAEPLAILAALDGFFAPYLKDGRLRVLTSYRPASADVSGDRVEAVTVRPASGGDPVVLRAPYFLDATEQGDLLPLTKAEHVTGFESQKETGEPHAPDEAHPGEIQSFTVCFAVEYCPGESHVVARPAEYAAFRDQVSSLGNFGFDPAGGANKYKTRDGKSNLWTYRRLLDRAQFEPGRYKGDVSVINWAQNDYYHGSLHAVAPEEAAKHLARAKQLSLSLLYWLQTEAPRPDGGAGWKELKLRPDVTGTGDGLAKHPYIRESRRIKAEFTVLEQHIAKKLRPAKGGEPKAEAFFDAVGVGMYHYMDLHRCAGGSSVRRGFDGSICPFQIPLGALLPRRVENLLAAGKCLGVTHLTNGAYRMHPVEWNAGEAAGALAAFCVARKEAPRRVRRDRKLLEEFQARLHKDGFELEWK